MTDFQPKPAIQELTDDHSAQLAVQRDWVAGHFDDAIIYEDTSNKLRVIKTILDNRWVDSSETVKLQCLGVAFGDALAETVGLIWVTFSHDGGEWPGPRFENTSLFVHPVTMISKRVEVGKDVDAIEVFRKVAHEIEGLKNRVD